MHRYLTYDYASDDLCKALTSYSDEHARNTIDGWMEGTQWGECELESQYQFENQSARIRLLSLCAQNTGLRAVYKGKVEISESYRKYFLQQRSNVCNKTYVIQLFIAQEITTFSVPEPSFPLPGACPIYLGFRGDSFPFQQHEKGRVAVTPWPLAENPTIRQFFR